jgi:hypothetical protein
VTIISFIITWVLVIIFISAALAPLESLWWYAGWSKKGGKSDPNAPDADSEAEGSAAEAPQAANHYLIYLSGIGAIAPNSIPDEELPFIEGLINDLPTTMVVTDVFPYSVTNMGLTGQRATARIWRWIEQLRLKNPMAVAALVVNIRNLFQVAISADRRYGPIYNWGVANAIYDNLVRRGYPLNTNTPVTLLGWSGGGQIALGAAWYLPGMLGGPVRIISVGGVMSDDMGVQRIEHLWHMWGEKDPLAPLGEKLYAGRWKMFPYSTWNRIVAEGKITMIQLGPFSHNGKGNYFDNETTLPSGETHMQYVLTTIKGLLVEEGLVPA